MQAGPGSRVPCRVDRHREGIEDGRVVVEAGQIGRRDTGRRRPWTVVRGEGASGIADARGERIVVKVRAAGEDVPFGREHQQRGPMAQSVAVADVGPQIGIDTHRHGSIGDGCDDVGSCEYLVAHAPAGRRPCRLQQEQDGPAAALRLEERGRVPRQPVDGGHDPIMACRWLIGSRSFPETASGQRSAPPSCASSRPLASSSSGRSITPASRPWSSRAARCRKRCSIRSRPTASP